MSSYDVGHGGNSPHRSLLSAVVLQAILDLDDKDETVCYEANQFFLAEKGGWADMRRFYFGALGLDDDRVRRALGPKLTMPERPEKRWMAENLFDVLPRVPFTAKEMMRLTEMGYTQVRTRLQTLEERGWIKKVSRAQFCRADYVPQPPPPPPQPKYLSHDAVRRLVYGLLVEPHSFKDLIIATNGEVGEGKIRDVLRNGLATFELSRADDGCYLLRAA